MARTAFSSLPPHARLWIFAAERPLSARERDYLLLEVEGFLDHWQAHGHPLTCAAELRYDQFLLVGVDESTAGASGCSVDTLVRDIKRIQATLGVALIDHSPVLFREGETIVRVPRDEFAERVRTGAVTPETIVFNNTLTRVADLQANRWEAPASQSWHAAAFF